MQIVLILTKSNLKSAAGNASISCMLYINRAVLQCRLNGCKHTSATIDIYVVGAVQRIKGGPNVLLHIEKMQN